MAYTKYTTEAFVITSRDTGEADKVFKLYTKDFGMIYALSKGVRHLKSKLKGHLNVGNRIKISLVRGKEWWRLVEAEELEKEQISIAKGKYLARILGVVSRLVQGEEPHMELFSLLLDFRKALHRESVAAEGLELIASARILKILGYESQEPLFMEISGVPFDDKQAEKALSEKRPLVVLINKVLSETHL